MIKIYNAGPLFSEAEYKQRLYEGNILHQLPIKLFNPAESPINDENPTSEMIFSTDYREIITSNVFFFDLTTNDPGTLVELGIVIEILAGYPERNIHIYPVFSDIRLKRKAGTGLDSSIGYNQFLTGAFARHHIKIYSSFNEAYEAFLNDFKGELQ